jgi:hypothetical protein
MSRTSSMSKGSGDSLKVSLRWGCKPNARQMRLTVMRLSPLALANQPLLPLRPGQLERRTHDYKRLGTTSLLAARRTHQQTNSTWRVSQCKRPGNGHPPVHRGAQRKSQTLRLDQNRGPNSGQSSLVTHSARPPRKPSTYDTNHWDRRLPRCYCSFAYSALAGFRMGMSGSASFQSLRKS